MATNEISAAMGMIPSLTLSLSLSIRFAKAQSGIKLDQIVVVVVVVVVVTHIRRGNITQFCLMQFSE